LLLGAARELKAHFVFDGEATGAGRDARLRLAAYRVNDGREQAGFNLTSAAGESFATQISDSIRKLRLELGEPPDSVSASAWNLHDSASPSPAALRSYFLGQQEYESGNTLKSLDYYGEAVRLDPGFPLAHYGRSRALLNLSRVPEALAAIERA